jgi:seryl-tRNA synthetase
MARTYAAILETYQRPDGTIDIPEVLQPYLRRPIIDRAPAPAPATA